MFDLGLLPWNLDTVDREINNSAISRKELPSNIPSSSDAERYTALSEGHLSM